MMNRVAVFCSGNGSNFEALVINSRKGKFPAEIVVMVCDRVDAFAIERAKKLDVPVLYIDPSLFKDKIDYEKMLIKELEYREVDWICLAGYMRLLSAYFVNRFKYRIVNIHPSLLPAFKGASAITEAYNYGVKITGVTVHLVDEKIDNGPIVLQESVKIQPTWSIEELESAIHKIEHVIFSEAMNILLTKKWEVVDGRRFICL